MGGRPKVSVTLPDELLIEMYHSKQPLHLLCEEHSVEDYALNNAWTQLKTEGKIKQGRRQVVRTDQPLSDRPSISDMDGRPSVGWEDKLLSRLIQVHERPRYDIAKAEDLVTG